MLNQKSLRERSVSPWVQWRSFLKLLEPEDADIRMEKARLFVEQMRKDVVSDSPSDAALHFPRRRCKYSHNMGMICGQLYFGDSCKTPLHAKIHWYRLIAQMSRRYCEQNKQGV